MLTPLDDLIAELASEAKRHTHAVSAKDRHQRLTSAAIRFVTRAAIGLGEDPAALRDLEQRLLTAVAATKRGST